MDRPAIIKRFLEFNDEEKETTQDTSDSQNYPHKDDVFDLDKIPMEILDKGWQRYRPSLFNVDHRHPFSNRILEDSTEREEQLKWVKAIILKTFPIGEEQFRIVEGHHGLFAAILTSTNDDNVDVIEDSMNKLGFFRSQPKNEKFLEDKKHRKWLDMRFEPKTCEDMDVTDQIHEDYNIAYHLAPSIFEDDIRRDGLKISNGNSEYEYSESRVYMLEGDASPEDIESLAATLYHQAYKKYGKDVTPVYTLFTLDINRMGDDIRFFHDVNEPKGFYTTSNIPAGFIIDMKRIDVLTNH